MPADVSEPDVRREVAVMSAAVRVPVSVAVAAVRELAWRPVAERVAEVKVPEMLAEAARSRPVTDAVFATKFPSTDAVFVTSEPIRTDDALGPRRSTPAEEPVPASRMRSPPTLPE